MHKVITFLGVLRQPPTLVRYHHDGMTYEGFTFTRPLYEIASRAAPVDRVIVFVTAKARETALPHVGLDPGILDPRDIPTGESADELWQIFEELTDVVERGDTVTFDVTHGLRSLPFLVFLAAAFLRSAKDATIRAVYYGALDLSARGEDGVSVAPVIDLSEFVALLDWLVASRAMIDTGDAGPLVRLLGDAAPLFSQGNTLEVVQWRGRLSNMRKTLERISLALRLTLPDQAMEESSRLAERIRDAGAATARRARPFAALADRVVEAYTPLALATPRDPAKAAEALALELTIVDWYCERGLLVQAVTLGREWIVGWAIVHAGYPNTYSRQQREEVEEALRGAIQQKRRKEPIGPHTFRSGRALGDIPALDSAVDLFAQLGDLRNTLNHAGKREERITAERLERSARLYCARLSELPLP